MWPTPHQKGSPTARSRKLRPPKRPPRKVYRRTPFRVNTMLGRPALGRHGVVDHGIALLAKPFSPKDLARKVREVLDSPAESQ